MRKSFFLTVLILCTKQFCLGQSCTLPDNPNSEFSIISGSYNNSACTGTSTQTWATGWYVSHGSPDIFGTNGNSANYALMWATATDATHPIGNSEGLFFNNYSFVYGHTYTITVRAAGDRNLPQTGFLVYAATGLSLVPLSSCTGYFPPTPSSQQLITKQNYISSGISSFVDRTFSFIADANYNQLWIYPFFEPTSTSTYTSQYTMVVDFVKICSSLCPEDLIFNHDYLPYGTVRGKKIDIGSAAGSGGYGTVTNLYNATTDLIASEEINFLPEFYAASDLVEPGELNAKIIPCSDGSQSRGQHRPTVTSNDPPQPFSVFPNPVTSHAEVQFIANAAGPIEIDIINSMGSVVQHMVYNVSNKLGKQQVGMNLSKFPLGIYIVQLKNQKGNALSKKIIKQ